MTSDGMPGMSYGCHANISTFFLRNWANSALSSASKLLPIKKNLSFSSESKTAGTWIRSSKTLSSGRPLAPPSMGWPNCDYYYSISLPSLLLEEGSHFSTSLISNFCWTTAQTCSDWWGVSFSDREPFTARLKQKRASSYLPLTTTTPMGEGNLSFWWNGEANAFISPSQLLPRMAL